MKCFNFTAGLISGVVLGLLTAPAKGEETRKKLSETASTWKNRIDEMMGRGDADLDELKNILEDEATILDTELKTRLLRLIARSKKAFSDAKEEAWA
jgi:gas vesicle protein